MSVPGQRETGRDGAGAASARRGAVSRARRAGDAEQALLQPLEFRILHRARPAGRRSPGPRPPTPAVAPDPAAVQGQVGSAAGAAVAEPAGGAAGGATGCALMSAAPGPQGDLCCSGEVRPCLRSTPMRTRGRRLVIPLCLHNVHAFNWLRAPENYLESSVSRTCLRWNSFASSFDFAWPNIVENYFTKVVFLV